MNNEIVHHQNSSPVCRTENRVDENNELSVYSGSLSKNVLDDCLKKLYSAFPNKSRYFWIELKESVMQAKLTDARLTDAVINAIRNTPINFFSISDIIGYDKKVKLLTISEFNLQAQQLYATHSLVKINNSYFYASNNDVERYELPKAVPMNIKTTSYKQEPETQGFNESTIDVILNEYRKRYEANKYSYTAGQREKIETLFQNKRYISIIAMLDYYYNPGTNNE